MILYLLANILILLLGLGVLNLLDKNNALTLLEKYVMGFILGIALNSFLLFVFAWAQVHIGIVKYIDMAIFLPIAFLNYRYGIWKRLIPLDFSMPKFTKRDLLVLPFVLLILFKAFFSFFNSVNVPSYFDDEKGNWNIKSKIIYQGGVINTSSGSETYVGGGGHREYPLNFILYKSYLADFMGKWNESYINLVTWILFNLVILLIIFSFSDRRFGIVVAYLMYSIPLVVWHSGTAYYDLIYACFYLLSLVFFRKFVINKESINLVVIGILLYSAIFTKNEGMIIVVPSILAGIGYYLYKEGLLKKGIYILLPILFILPHMVFRLIHHLSFNPHSTGASYGFHADSLILYFQYFTQWGSYNIFWYAFVVLVIYFARDLLKEKFRSFSISLASLAFIIFFVFSFTNNYQFLLDQTTINRTLLVLMISIIYFYMYLAYERLR